MAKVVFKVTKKGLDEANDRGDFEQPQPGIYIGKLTSCEPYFPTKDGKPDKTRPSLECIYKIVGIGRENETPDKNYSQLWDYVSLKGEETEWKRGQFALAMGLADGSKAFSGSVETNELLNTLVVLRVKKDADKEGNYRGKIAFVGPFDTEGDENDAFGDGEEAGEEEAFGEESEDDSLYSEEDLVAMEPAELKELAEQYEIPVKGKKPSQVRKEILEAQAAAVAEETPSSEEEPF